MLFWRTAGLWLKILLLLGQIQIYKLSIVTGYVYKTYQINKYNAIKPHCCLDPGLIFNLILRTLNKIYKTNLILSFSQKTECEAKLHPLVHILNLEQQFKMFALRFPTEQSFAASLH